jgi:predicted Zn-dependent protease
VGCATPQYAVRPAPVPEETATTLQIERAISQMQAETFEQDGARLLGTNERISSLPVQAIIERLRVVTERPHLPYRALLYEDTNPNAAALADGRIYLSTGMLAYLKSRGSRESELAAILGHEDLKSLSRYVEVVAREVKETHAKTHPREQTP